MSEGQDAVATVADDAAPEQKPERGPEAAATAHAPPKAAENANLKKARETARKFTKKMEGRPGETAEEPAAKPVAAAPKEGEAPADKGESAKPEEKPEVKTEPKSEAPRTLTLETLDPVLRQVCARGNITDAYLERLGDMAQEFVLREKERQDNLSAEFGRLGRGKQPEAPTQEDARATTGRAARPAEAEPAAAPETGEGDILARMGITIDPAEHGEEIKTAFEKVGTYIADRDKDLADLKEYVDEQKAVALLDATDRYIADLGDAYSKVYGKGTTLSLDQEGAEFKARKALLEEADQIMAGATLRGRAMTMDEALDRALSIKHKDRFKQEAREELASELSERSGQAVQKPTNRDAGRTETGVQKARKTERAYKEKHGL